MVLFLSSDEISDLMSPFERTVLNNRIYGAAFSYVWKWKLQKYYILEVLLQVLIFLYA